MFLRRLTRSSAFLLLAFSFPITGTEPGSTAVTPTVELRTGPAPFSLGAMLAAAESATETEFKTYQVRCEWETKSVGSAEYPAGLTAWLRRRHQREWPEWLTKADQGVLRRRNANPRLSALLSPTVGDLTLWTFQTRADWDAERHIGKQTERIIAVRIVFFRDADWRTARAAQQARYREPVPAVAEGAPDDDVFWEGKNDAVIQMNGARRELSWFSPSGWAQVIARTRPLDAAGSASLPAASFGKFTPGDF